MKPSSTPMPDRRPARARPVPIRLEDIQENAEPATPLVYRRWQGDERVGGDDPSPDNGASSSAMAREKIDGYKKLNFAGWSLRYPPAEQTRRCIAFVVHKFPPESLGGTEIYTWGLAKALTELGHEAHIFYPTQQLAQSNGQERRSPFEKGRTSRDGVHLWRVPLPESRKSENPLSQYWHTFRDLEIEKRFRLFLDEVKPDLVHFQHVQGVSARLIELAAPLPRIITLHDYWYFCANSQLIRPDRTPCNGPDTYCTNCVDCATERSDLKWMRSIRPLVALPFAYRNRYLRKLAEQVDLFIAPSRFLRQQYIRHGFPAERILLLENGLDQQKLANRPGMAAHTDAPEPQDMSGLQPSDRPHFGFLGSLAWQKGVHVLIEAFNRLSTEASLTIYGSEEVFPDYVAQIKQMARHPNIRFGGCLPPEQVGEALRQMDCLVVPSLWYENSPLVIQEAFGVGVPVVASRLGALSEKVADRHSGRLFSAGDIDELTAVLQDLVERPAQLQQMARTLQPAPDMEEHAGRLLTIYSELIDQT